MKKNIGKILATTLALTIVAVSPSTVITAHALGFNIDAVENGESNGAMPDNYWDEPTYEEPAYEVPSYSEPVYEAPVYEEPSYESSSSEESPSSESSYEAPANNNSASKSSATSTVNVSKKNANDMTVNVTGGQKFRIVMSADHKSYQVYHCGISRATFVVADADGNTATYSSAALAQGEDGLWYMNISFPQGVDTTGYVVGVTKGDATYLSTTLGVSGIKVNGILALSTIPATDTN